MTDLLLQLVPEMLGLLITPAAVVGCVLLLQSARPVTNALGFTAGFMTQYTVVAVAALIGGAARDDPSADQNVKGWVSAAVGALFLLLALAVMLRRTDSPAEPGWMRQLEHATPRRAFTVGVGMSVLNPNVAILLSGMSAIAAAGVGTSVALTATLALLAACLLDFAVPIGVYLALGRRARRGLDSAKQLMIRHNLALGVGVLLVFGVLFLVRGLNTVMA